ncbi:dTDP-glucose 4,6-dehydratase [Corynebacterium bovis]|uniref:dTDP-glucose 4,6-dehydratase n=1 Tax=Corynebacterium bovis TaxID=36808 RepID=UPI00255006EA|nr:dTDP-glucose 4,6-dehydratase [Corynebacterium bovis]MDK8511060.1 dTDP-glucose 4,6-dehydratase [Corynebacterium bovis]
MRSVTHVLVTGGAGFIGSNFVHRTLATRPDVHVTVLDAMTYAANPANLRTDDGTALVDAHPGRVAVVVGSVTDPVVVGRAVGDVADAARQAGGGAAVVHFAAESHNDNSLSDPLAFVRTNVEGTVVLAGECVRHGVHLHHVSTDEVFGDLPLDPAEGDGPFTTATPYAPSSSYSASKAASDHFVRAFVRSHGLAATLSNCSNNYGPRQHPEKFIPRQVTGLIEGELPRVYGTGGNVRDWIHVDDHNDAVWTILGEGEVGRTYLVGARGERSNVDVVGDVLELFGRGRDDFVRVTDRPGHDRRYAIDPTSTEELGWRPRHTFAGGLRDTVEWYRAHPGWWREARRASEERYRRTERPLG